MISLFQFRGMISTPIWLIFSIIILCHAQQQPIDPAYLQQYYQQVAAQAGHRAAAGAKSEATPIFEPNSEAASVPQQYVPQGQQIRLRDNVQDQVRIHKQQQSQQIQAYVAPQVRSYVQQPQYQYVQQPQVAPKGSLHRQSDRDEKLGKENQEDYDPNPSYQFGFDVKDDEFTNYQNRKEVREGNVITGSYSVVDSDGFIRTVKYTADPKEGFKAEVVREPTDIVVKVPTPAPQTQSAGVDQYLRTQVASQRFNAQQQERAPHQQYQYHQ